MPVASKDRGSSAFGAVLAVLGILALTAPLRPATASATRVGALLLAAATLEILHGFRRRSAKFQNAAWFGGTVTFLMGVLLMNAPFVVGTALVLFLAGWFAVDGIRYALSAARALKEGGPALRDALAAAGNLGVVGVVFFLESRSLVWCVAVVGSLRILGAAWNVLKAEVRGADDVGEGVLADLGVPENSELRALVEELEAEAKARVQIDRRWIWAFLVTLFAIHLGRMGFDRTPLGVVAPTVAVLGDVFVALALAFLVAGPLRVAGLKLWRPLERRLWPWCLAAPRSRGKRAVRQVLESRLRASVRLRNARYSVRLAIDRGLQIGLPIAAVLVAIIPVLGMSWYFDTENWAAGM